MSVITQTSSVLKVCHRTSILGTVLFGLIFSLTGLAVAFLFGRLNILTCVQGNPVSCTLTEENFFTNTTTTIGNLKGAEIHEDEDDDGTTYQVILITERGKLGLTSYTSSGYSQKQKQVDQINAFVQSSQPFLEIRQDDRLVGYSFGGLFFVCGLAIMAPVFDSLTAIFDKSQGKFYLHQISLFSNCRHEYPLYQILKVDVEEKTDSDGDCSYRLGVVLRSGERLPLTMSFVSPSQKQDEENKATQIRQFLGLRDADPEEA
jgi:hypothetical protein